MRPHSYTPCLFSLIKVRAQSCCALSSILPFSEWALRLVKEVLSCEVVAAHVCLNSVEHHLLLLRGGVVGIALLRLCGEHSEPKTLNESESRRLSQLLLRETRGEVAGGCFNQTKV